MLPRHIFSLLRQHCGPVLGPLVDAVGSSQKKEYTRVDPAVVLCYSRESTCICQVNVHAYICICRLFPKKSSSRAYCSGSHHNTMSSSTTAPQQRSFFSIPPLVKTLFDAFPLITYPAYPAPARSPAPSTLPRLYAWISAEEARRPGGAGYSFDAECLKWQVGGYFRLFARPGLRKLIHCDGGAAAGGGHV